MRPKEQPEEDGLWLRLSLRRRDWLSRRRRRRNQQLLDAGLPDDPKRYRLPAIDRYAVLHLRPEAYASGYSLVEYNVGQPEFQAFLAALSLSAWSRNAKPVGEPIVNKWTRQRVPKVEVPV